MLKSGVESLGRVRLQGVALLILAFVIGALAGGTLVRIRIARRLHDQFGMSGIGGHVPRMFHELDLSSDQKDRIHKILEASRPKADAILRESLPRLRAVTDSIHAEIRAVLTPEQRPKFDRMVARYDRRGFRGLFSRRFGVGIPDEGRSGSPPDSTPREEQEREEDSLASPR